MSRSSALTILGFLVILTPFSGLPFSVRTILLVLFGAAAVGIGFSLRPTEQRASVERLAESSAMPMSERAPDTLPAPEPILAEPPHTISPI